MALLNDVRSHLRPIMSLEILINASLKRPASAVQLRPRGTYPYYFLLVVIDLKSFTFANLCLSMGEIRVILMQTNQLDEER